MSVDTDYETLRSVLKVAKPGWAAEFGVFSGYSLRIIAEHMPVIGFDSFDGLPEDWRKGFPRGKFRNPRPAPAPWNAMLVIGLFEDTATEFPFPPLSLVHIDCDLYSSSLTALHSVAPYVGPGTILVFDEFHSYEGAEQHEQRALIEWSAEYGVATREISRGSGKNAQESAYIIESMGVQA